MRAKSVLIAAAWGINPAILNSMDLIKGECKYIVDAQRARVNVGRRRQCLRLLRRLGRF